MSGSQGPGKEPTKKRQFINEKIVKPKLTRRQVTRRFLALLFSAAVFGVVAAVTFVVSKPFAEKYLGEESTVPTTPVLIPKDEPETSTAALEPESATAESETETEPIEDMVQSAIEKYQFGVEDLNTLFGNMRQLCQEVDKGIVSVHSVKTQIDWFDNPVENTGLYAGAVIALTDQELLILTPQGAVKSADSIEVSFGDGTAVAGAIKQADDIAGLAIVSVNTADLDPSLLNTVKVIELGNSYTVRQGDLVAAVGSPAGIVHSSNYGFVSYITKNIQVTDGVTGVIYADTKSNAAAGTFLINTSGQLIGWVTDAYNSEESQNMCIAMGISDYKGTLGKMTNGMDPPYFGVRGQEVSAEMTATGMPSGVYVIDSITGGPAYSAGIQSGDIIVKIGEKSVITSKELQGQIESMKNGDVISVYVQRYGREEYKELEYQVTIGAR